MKKYYNNLFSMKDNAFTLAEVLITLGIVGVVAAITIPNLIANSKAHKLRSQFLRSYSTIQQAFKLMEQDDVSIDPSTYPAKTFYKTFFQYFVGGLDCGAGKNVPLPCYYGGSSVSTDERPPYKSLDGKSDVSYIWFDDGQLALPDGSLISLENPSANGSWVSVDLNGYNNPPNRWGYDLFTFQFIDGELITMGDIRSKYPDTNKYCNRKGSGTMNGVSCAQLAKQDPDYFKTLVKEIK